MTNSERVERMTYTDNTGETITVDHVQGKGFRARRGSLTVRKDMTALDLWKYTKELRERGYALAEAV